MKHIKVLSPRRASFCVGLALALLPFIGANAKYHRLGSGVLGGEESFAPLPTNATKAYLQTAVPSYPSASGVTKTGSEPPPIQVDLIQQGTTAQGKVLVVLKIKINTGATLTVGGSGVILSGSGNGTTYYGIVELATADAANWSLNVGIGSNSNVRFVRGNG